MAWFWDQHGKTLKVVALEAEGHPNFWSGPFDTEADALRDALSEYSETWGLYSDAIVDAQDRLKQIT